MNKNFFWFSTLPSLKVFTHRAKNRILFSPRRTRKARSSEHVVSETFVSFAIFVVNEIQGNSTRLPTQEPERKATDQPARLGVI
jgi:hypothetical protein